MKNKVEIRYSQAFKLQVVKELESGVFDSPKAASRHYGIKGATTVRDWLRKMGKDHLLTKLVRVETVGEADRIARLQKQVEQLERALGQSAAERLLAEQYLKLACGRLGEEVEAFKKSPMVCGERGNESGRVGGWCELEDSMPLRRYDAAELLQAAACASASARG